MREEKVEDTRAIRRGDETRQRLILAAVDVFGRLGYEGASTRKLAEAADANLAAIPYYFDSKEGMYLAAAKHIVEGVDEHLKPSVERMMDDLMRVTREGQVPLDKGTALSMLHELLSKLAEIILRKEGSSWARFIIREQMEPTAAFEVLYEGFMKRFVELVARFVGCLSEQPADGKAVRLLALTLIGNVLIFRMAHAAALRQMGWEEIGPIELAEIQKVVRANVSAILSGTGEAKSR